MVQELSKSAEVEGLRVLEIMALKGAGYLFWRF